MWGSIAKIKGEAVICIVLNRHCCSSENERYEEINYQIEATSLNVFNVRRCVQDFQRIFVSFTLGWIRGWILSHVLTQGWQRVSIKFKIVCSPAEWEIISYLTNWLIFVVIEKVSKVLDEIFWNFMKTCFWFSFKYALTLRASQTLA